MKNGYFETEILLDLEVTYEYFEHEGQIELETLRIELGNGENIDLFHYLPVEILDDICNQIMENIEDEKNI